MTFNNSILSGTTLARENIQSEGFVAGSTGWIIERDGDAEFNSIIVRGDVISIGNDYTVSIVDGEIIISLNSNPTDNVRINSTGLEFNDSGGSFTRLHYVEAEGLGFRDNSSTRGVFYDNDTGFLVVADSAPWTVEGWKNLTLPTGWSAAVACQYKLFPDGIVRLRGRADSDVNPIVDGTAIDTLPAGYRPAQELIVPISFSGSNTTGRIRVRTNGVIDVFGAPNDLPNLDSVSFSTV